MNTKEFLRAVVASHSIGLGDRAAVIAVMQENQGIVIVSCGESVDRKKLHKAIQMSDPTFHDTTKVELGKEDAE